MNFHCIFELRKVFHLLILSVKAVNLVIYFRVKFPVRYFYILFLNDFWCPLKGCSLPLAKFWFPYIKFGHFLVYVESSWLILTPLVRILSLLDQLLAPLGQVLSPLGPPRIPLVDFDAPWLKFYSSWRKCCLPLTKLCLPLIDF